MKSFKQLDMIYLLHLWAFPLFHMCRRLICRRNNSLLHWSAHLKQEIENLSCLRGRHMQLLDWCSLTLIQRSSTHRQENVEDAYWQVMGKSIEEVEVFYGVDLETKHFWQWISQGFQSYWFLPQMNDIQDQAGTWITFLVLTLGLLAWFSKMVTISYSRMVIFCILNTCASQLG